MARLGKRISRYRCFFPLLFSFSALLLFLPVYDAGLAYCDGQPLVTRMDCVSHITLSIAWIFLIPFMFGILAFACRAYQDWGRSEYRLERNGY